MIWFFVSILLAMIFTGSIVQDFGIVWNEASEDVCYVYDWWHNPLSIVIFVLWFLFFYHCNIILPAFWHSLQWIANHV